MAAGGLGLGTRSHLLPSLPSRIGGLPVGSRGCGWHILCKLRVSVGAGRTTRSFRGRRALRGKARRARRRRVVLGDILPGVALNTGRAGEARAARVVISLFLLGVGEDFVGGLDPRESLPGLDLTAGVAVGVIFEGCKARGSGSGRRHSQRLDQANIPSFLYCFLTVSVSTDWGSSRSA